MTRLTATELRDAREELLRRFLERLRYAAQRPAGRVTPTGLTIPVIELTGVSSDQLRVVMDGIEKALQGHPDPFGLAPRRGIIDQKLVNLNQAA